QVWRTGASGCPVIMPLRLLWALSYMVWVNRLTTNPLAPARRRRMCWSDRSWVGIDGAAEARPPKSVTLSCTPQMASDAMTVQTRSLSNSQARLQPLNPQPKRDLQRPKHNPNWRFTSEQSVLRRGNWIAAVMFPRGWGVNRGVRLPSRRAA